MIKLIYPGDMAATRVTLTNALDETARGCTAESLTWRQVRSVGCCTGTFDRLKEPVGDRVTTDLFGTGVNDRAWLV